MYSINNVLYEYTLNTLTINLLTITAYFNHGPKRDNRESR